MSDDGNKDSELSGSGSEDSDKSSLHCLPPYTYHDGQAPAASVRDGGVPDADAGTDREL